MKSNSRSFNRLTYQIFVLFSFVAVLSILLFGIGQLLAYLNTGADRSSMLHQHIFQTQYMPKVIWTNTTNPGRPISPQSIQAIEKDYLQAWYTRCLAFQTNITTGLEDYHSPQVVQKINTLISHNRLQGTSVQSTSIRHQLDLKFYSEDGQLAVLKDHEVATSKFIFKEDALRFKLSDQSDYQAILALEDGFWRVRHFVKTKTGNNKNLQSKAISTLEKQACRPIFPSSDQIKGINYYPKDTPWDLFGEDFELQTIQQDFALLSSSGLNTIRIFIPYASFGKSKVSGPKLDKLQQVLDAAQTIRLKVIVTLFDFYGDYSPIDWTQTHRHAEQITSRFSTHPAILAWDIKNEPNLDFKTRGKSQVLEWLSVMIDQIRQFDPNHWITIGWSDSTSALLLNEKVDLVSFHFYKKISDLEASIFQLKNQVNKPLVLQEFGISSDLGFWNPFGNSERDQAEYHQKVQKLIKKHQLHYLSWTLYDFKKIPKRVIGINPWQRRKQKHFGFIDSKGNKKPAFAYLSK